MSDVMEDPPFKPVVGYRFRPTDEELINHYLKRKINGQIKADFPVIAEVDIGKCDPWDLPAKSLIQADDPEWFFFARKERKARNSQRWKRATPSGNWKSTGQDKTIKTWVPSPMEIGKRKTLVFQSRRAPGEHTCWTMYEYRTVEPGYEQGDFVLCRLCKKHQGIASNAAEIGSSSVEKPKSCPKPPPPRPLMACPPPPPPPMACPPPPPPPMPCPKPLRPPMPCPKPPPPPMPCPKPPPPPMPCPKAKSWDPSCSFIPYGRQNLEYPKAVGYGGIQDSFDEGIFPFRTDWISSNDIFVKRERPALKKPPKAVVITLVLCVFFFGIGWFAKTLNSKI